MQQGSAVAAAVAVAEAGSCSSNSITGLETSIGNRYALKREKKKEKRRVKLTQIIASVMRTIKQAEVTMRGWMAIADAGFRERLLE